MQIDSMISNMRNRSIMKDKQKTNLKLYDEIDEIDESQNEIDEMDEQIYELPEVDGIESDFDERFEVDEADEPEDFEDFDELEDFDFASESQHHLEEVDFPSLFEGFSNYMNLLKEEVDAHLDARTPQSIYEENGIESDLKSGIFMIDMYRMNLPDELDEKIKHKSVIDILNAFEISQEVLEQDAEDRKAALESYMQALKRSSGESISEYRDHIKRLEGFVERINQMISAIEEFYKSQFKVMKAEQSKIESALKFMKGQDFMKNKIQKKAQTKRSMKKQGEGR